MAYLVQDHRYKSLNWKQQQVTLIYFKPFIYQSIEYCFVYLLQINKQSKWRSQMVHVE